MKELVAIFPVLRDWIAEFLSENKCMYASDVGHNMLIEQVIYLKSDNHLNFLLITVIFSLADLTFSSKFLSLAFSFAKEQRQSLIGS